MKHHLLSIFPLAEGDVYARVSLLAMEETAVPGIVPFTVSRSLLVTMLEILFPQDGMLILLDLDAGSVVQRPVDDGDALTIGAYAHNAPDTLPAKLM